MLKFKRNSPPTDVGLFDYSQYPTGRPDHPPVRRKAIGCLAVAVTLAAAAVVGVAEDLHEYPIGSPHSLGTENGLEKILQGPERQLAATALGSYQTVWYSHGSDFNSQASEQPLGGGWTEYSSRLPDGRAYDTIVKTNPVGHITAVAMAAGYKGLSYVVLSGSQDPINSEVSARTAAATPNYSLWRLDNTTGWYAATGAGAIDSSTGPDATRNTGDPGVFANAEAAAATARNYFASVSS